jgi:hypothetical protein
MEHKIANPNKPVNSAIFYEETGCTLVIRNDEWFVIGDVTVEEANNLIASHNPPIPTEPTIADKLASVGLSIEELKAALGGN